MIIARYLIKEITLTLFAVSLVLMLIGQSGQVVAVFSEVTAGNLGLDTVMVVVGLKTLEMLLVVLPLSVYLAVLMTLSRLYQNNEMTAISACGVSQYRVLRSVLSISFLFAIFIGILSLQLNPWAKTLMEQIEVEAQNSSELEGTLPGRFNESMSGVGVTYVEEINEERTELKNLFIQQQLPGDLEVVIRAKKGMRDVTNKGDRFLILENGVRYESIQNSPGYTIIDFSRHGVRLEKEDAASLSIGHTMKPTPELLKDKSTRDIAEFHSRIAPILLCLLFSALAVPLSQTSPRQGRYFRLGLGLIIYVGTSNLINIGKNWIIVEKVPAFIGLWWIHLLLLAVIIFLFMQQSGFRYLFSKQKVSPAS